MSDCNRKPLQFLPPARMIPARTRGEMDIITDFGSVVPGSSPGGCTCLKTLALMAGVFK